MVYQRPVLSRADVERELEDILTKGIPGGAEGPDASMLRKASTDVQRIMALFDRYVTR